MKTIKSIKTFSMAGGTALMLGMASGTALAADSNPFGMTNLSDGYQVAVNEGKCGEGKCGGKEAAAMPKDAEGKCGDKESKQTEGKCGENKTKVQEAKCGAGS